jgi:hypothetical protein
VRQFGHALGERVRVALVLEQTAGEQQQFAAFLLFQNRASTPSSSSMSAHNGSASPLKRGAR